MAPAGVAVDFSVGAPAFSPYGSVSRGSVKRVVPEVPLPVVTVNAPPPVPDFAQLYKVNVPRTGWLITNIKFYIFSPNGAFFIWLQIHASC